ncbi:MAG: hypothetical protein JSR98_01085 [Proteobacteria bacterium]|nr:hypothetical protein [Pseudomonadota bacterium]
MTAATLFHPVTAPRDRGWLSLLALLRPIVALAALAFFAGFGGYLILGPPHVLADAPAAQPAVVEAPAAIPAEAPAPNWDPPRQV